MSRELLVIDFGESLTLYQSLIDTIMQGSTKIFQEHLSELRSQLREVASGDRQIGIDDAGFDRIKARLGINIDVRTLKKLVRDSAYIPRTTILNSIVEGFGFEDWADFVKNLKEEATKKEVEKAKTKSKEKGKVKESKKKEKSVAQRKIVIEEGHYNEITGDGHIISFVHPNTFDSKVSGSSPSPTAGPFEDGAINSHEDVIPVIKREYHFYTIINKPKNISIESMDREWFEEIVKRYRIRELFEDIDSKKSDSLVEIAYATKPEFVTMFLENTLSERTHPGDRLWSYITLGKIGGEGAREILKKAQGEEKNDFAAHGVERGLELLEINENEPNNLHRADHEAVGQGEDAP